MTARARVTALLAVAVLGLGACTGAGAGQAGSGGGGGGGARTVTLDVRYSRFEPATVRVARGTTVRFVVRNGDPIDHELIVGPPDVQDRHEEGTERAHHGDVPGEVSVPAGATAETTYRFDRPSRVTFACHLPGHLAYGMSGVVIVD